VRAAEALAALPLRTPVLAVLVPRAWYEKSGRARLSDGGRRHRLGSISISHSSGRDS
jgi:putative tryptophan/tyrosine transport system substrate-binding protein